MLKDLKLKTAGPSDSCRSDYMAVSYRLPTNNAEDELFAYVHDLSEKILPVGGFADPRKGRYYERVYSHASGISFEFTPTESGKSTRGCGLINIPGACWAALDASERRDLIVDLRYWPGFYRCTRWDPQVTVLNPPITVAEVIADVSAGRLWARGFSEENPWTRKNRHGELIKSPTQYFGAPTSNVMVRIYDHGVQHNWDTTSLRVEAQLRKDVADQHFRRLAERCYSETSEDPLFVSQEQITVKDALKQHIDLRDTTEWEGRPKPRKWAQKAPKAEWWTQMLDHKGTPLVLEQRPELDWDQTKAAMKDQYGRKFFLWVSRECLRQGKSSAEVLESFRIECAAKLKKGDDKLLASQVPEINKEAAMQTVRRAARTAALWEEGLEETEGTKTPLGNTGVKVPLGADPQDLRAAESGATFSDLGEEDPHASAVKVPKREGSPNKPTQRGRKGKRS